MENRVMEVDGRGDIRGIREKCNHECKRCLSPNTKGRLRYGMVGYDSSLPQCIRGVRSAVLCVYRDQILRVALMVLFGRAQKLACTKLPPD